MNTAVRTSLRSRMQGGVTWNVIGAIFTSGSNFLSNVIIANLLGRDVFGEYGMVQSTVITIAVIAQMATGYTATKYVAEFRFTDREKVGRILGLCSTVASITAAVAAASLLLGASWLAAHMLKAPHLRGGLMIAAGFVFFSVLNGYQTGALAGLESFRALAACSAIHGTAAIVICALSTWLWGLEGAISALVLGALLRLYLFSWALKAEAASQKIEVRLDGIWKEREVISKFALPTAVAGFSSMPALWLANAFLVRQQSGYSQMGLYASANNLKSLVLFLPMLLNNVSMSMLNSQRGIGDEKSYRKVFWTNMAFTAGVALAGAVLVAVSGKWLLRLYGKDFPEGYPVLLVLMGATVFESLTMASYQIIQCQERMWLSFFAITLPRDAMIAMLAYLLTPVHGALGLAGSYSAAHAVAFLVTLTIICFIGLNPRGNGKVAGVAYDAE